MHRRGVRFSIIFGSLMLIVLVVLMLPLATIYAPAGSYIYVNGTLNPQSSIRTNFGYKTIAAAAPLYEKTETKTLLLPFGSYRADQKPTKLTVDKILDLTKTKESGYVVGDTKFILGNKWLVVTLGSPVPDGGAYSVVLFWQAKTGTWQKAGTYDGGDTLSFAAPGAVKAYLGVQ